MLEKHFQGRLLLLLLKHFHRSRDVDFWNAEKHFHKHSPFWKSGLDFLEC